MSYSVIENFSSGVDRTRPIYALPAGSLWECVNGHISRGGDVEKRKAFVEKYVLPTGSTVGLATTDDAIYVFGSAAEPPGIPAGVTYQRLRHPDGSTAMTKLVSHDLFDGKVYAVALFADGNTYHYYDGEIVADWYTGIVRPDMVDNAGIAEHLRELIDADDDLVGTRTGSIVTIEKAVDGTFEISASTENVEGGVDDQELELTRLTLGKAEVLARVSITITGGTYNPGVDRISALTINGVSVISGAINWESSNENTAFLIAQDITSFNSTPEYTATSEGNVITIFAATGSGATPNGYVVAVTVGGTVTISNGGIMRQGVTGEKEKWTAEVKGTFEVGDKFDIFIDELKHFGYGGNPRGTANFVKTLKRKVYASAGSLLNFSGVDDATLWNLDEDAGAGFSNISNNSSGSATITGLSIYQDKLAIFSRRDDAGSNTPVQIIGKTGTRAPRSIQEFGDLDVFYLADTGIRSLRARDTTNTAGIQDVGTPIDTLIREWVQTLAEEIIENSVAVVEPTDGRYWIAIGTRIYVFTYFPSKRISAWTWYEPGFTVEYFADQKDRILARSGDTIYLYGGDDNNTYDTSEVRVVVPFIDLSKPNTFKNLTQADIAARGTWDVSLMVDPNNIDVKTRVGQLEGVTYAKEGAAAIGHHTHFAIELVNQEAGYTSLSAACISMVGGDGE
jgi:hypothetical protein